MSIQDIQRELQFNVEGLAAEFLPGGKRQGREWVCGDIDGNSGQSFKLCLQGHKAGIWSDFATGEAGDLIDLWAYHRTGKRVGDALREIRDRYGIIEPEFYGKAKKQYSRPPSPKKPAPKDRVREWLHARGLTDATIEAFKLSGDGQKVYLPYFRDGELIACKYRNIDDKKDQRFTTADQEKILFGWQCAEPDAREIYLTEGEFDAMAMHQMGFRPALSVPMGGGDGAKQSWIENEFENLDQFRTIYLCLDMDEPGEVASRSIAERLGVERCRRVALPCKDPGDTLQAQKTTMLCDAIRSAKEYEPANIRNAREYADEVVGLFYPIGAVECIPMPFEKCDVVKLYPAELSIWSGFSGSGKSMILQQVCNHAVLLGKRVFMFSGEMRPAKFLKRAVKQVTGMDRPSAEHVRQAMDWLGEGFWLFERVGKATQAELLKAMEYARRRYGVDLVVIDSLAKLDIAEDDIKGQKEFISAVCDFKNSQNCHVALVAHSKKLENETKRSGKFDVRGSAAITDLADSVFTVWRNKPKEKALREKPGDYVAAEKPDCVFSCVKVREDDGEEGSWGLFFDRITLQYRESQFQDAFVYVPRPSHEST